MKLLEVVWGPAAQPGVTSDGVAEALYHSKIAEASSSRQDQARRPSNSRYMVDQNDSLMVLSMLEATRPIEPEQAGLTQPAPTDRRH